MGGGGDDEEVRIMALGYEVTVGVLLLKVNGGNGGNSLR